MNQIFLAFAFGLLVNFLSAGAFAETIGSCTPSGSITRCEVSGRKLAFADQNNIKYRVFKLLYDREMDTQESRFGYAFEFESVNQAQYFQLMARYGGQELVPFEPGRKYELVDFLPPYMQATLNHTLQQEDLELPDDYPMSWANPSLPNPREFQIGMNCWDVAYAYLWGRHQKFSRQPFEARAFHIGVPIVDTVLKNRRFYKERFAIPAEALPPHSPGKLRNQGRIMGDLLLLDTLASKGQAGAHVAIWIDEDLFFEKVDMGTEDPIRLSFYDTSVSPWLNEVVLNSEEYPPALWFYRFEEKTLPDPLTFTDRHFFNYNWHDDRYDPDFKPGEEMPAKYKGIYIFNFDLGFGTGLTSLRITPVYKFTLTQDPSGRASVRSVTFPHGSFKSLF